MAASLPYFKGFQARTPQYPNLLRWYEAMDGRPAYQGIKSDYYTHCQDLPPQIGPCPLLPAAAPFQARIDGADWAVSVSAGACFEPMLPLCEHTASRTAVRNLLLNHAAVAAFCTRAASLAAGRTGGTVSAPLADPNTPPEPSLVPVVDSALRWISLSLLQKPEEPLQIERSSAKQLAACLLYLRDRIGVPRDMTVHAARQLRAHINLFLDSHRLR